MKRREFLVASAVAVTTSPACLSALSSSNETPAKLKKEQFSKWKGVNLLEKFTDSRNAPFVEKDFEWLRDWGFRFVRLPLSYRCWSAPEQWLEMDEKVLKEIDEAVELGRQYGIHVNINFHRAPGYCVNPPAEPKSLWVDAEALEAACFHWGRFAARYKGISSERLSFDLLNEPAGVSEEVYARVVRGMVAAIREEDRDRLIVADGLQWGREPVHSIVDLNVAQSTRGYDPMKISHYQASWVRGSDQYPVPRWPLEDRKDPWDKERLFKERILPWMKLEQRGVPVHVGEWGCYNKTPHSVALSWMRDCLELWREANWGWSLWNLRGAFGFVDSGRNDLVYEPYQGHQIDRKMLELLKEYL